MSIERLLRESNPPAGMLAAPVPQYEDVSTGHPGAVKGRNGAPFAELIGPNGQPISASNPLEVRVRELESELQELRQLFADGTAKMQLSGSTVDMATETTLAQSVDKLNSILSRLEGKLDTAIFDSQGNPISAANRLPVEATLSGQIVELSSVSNFSVTAGTKVILFPSVPVAMFAGVSLRLRNFSPSPFNAPIGLTYSVWGSIVATEEPIPLLGDAPNLINRRAATRVVPVTHPTITVWLENKHDEDITYEATLYGIPRG